MTAPRGETDLQLLGLGRQALRCTSVELAQRLGVSRRTVTRWFAGHSMISSASLGELAHLVDPVEPALAARIWARAAAGLTSAGLPAPAPLPSTTAAAAPKAAPSAAPRAPSPPSHLVDGVVCAACDVLDVVPRAMRPALAAAFRRARELGLRVEDVEEALGGPTG
jgi:hypothetical protein